MSPKPATGLGVPTGKPVVPPGLRISVFIDYIKLVLRFQQELQPASITKRLPDEWKAFAKVNIAAHIPGAKSSAPNTCDCYTLTLHEPHKNPVSLMQLSFLLNDSGATLDRGQSAVEWGIDLYPTKDAPFNRVQFGKLGESMTQCLNVQLIGLPLTPAAATSRNRHSNKRTTDMARDIARGWTVYLGEQPDFKDANNRHRWRDCIGFKAYYKITDQGMELPPDQHRLRLEFTASATNCPVDVIGLLENNKAEKKKLARYFHLDMQAPGLLQAMLHYLRARCAALPASVFEKARALHKRPLDLYCGEEEVACRVKRHPGDAVKSGKRTRWPTDNNWNDRITRAFERLPIGPKPVPGDC